MTSDDSTKLPYSEGQRVLVDAVVKATSANGLYVTVGIQSWNEAADAVPIAVEPSSVHATEQSFNPVIVAHGEGADTVVHPFGKLCARCTPPFEITDEMVARAQKRLGLFLASDGHIDDAAATRLILQAAING